MAEIKFTPGQLQAINDEGKIFWLLLQPARGRPGCWSNVLSERSKKKPR